MTTRSCCWRRSSSATRLRRRPPTTPRCCSDGTSISSPGRARQIVGRGSGQPSVPALQAAAMVGLGDHARAIPLYHDLLRDAPPDRHAAELHLSIAHSLKTLGRGLMRSMIRRGDVRLETRTGASPTSRPTASPTRSSRRCARAERPSNEARRPLPSVFALGKAYEDRGSTPSRGDTRARQ